MDNGTLGFPVEGHWGRFQFGAFMQKRAVAVCVGALVRMPCAPLFLLDTHLGMVWMFQKLTVVLSACATGHSRPGVRGLWVLPVSVSTCALRLLILAVLVGVNWSSLWLEFAFV